LGFDRRLFTGVDPFSATTGLVFSRDPRKFFDLEPEFVQLLPPMFCFNQSRPLFTVFEAIFIVALFTLLAIVSKTLLQKRLFNFCILDLCLVFIFLAKVVDLDLMNFTLALTESNLALALALMELILPFVDFTLFLIEPNLDLMDFTLDLTEPIRDLREPTRDLILEMAPIFLPLQKLLNPFFKHCIPFLIANCLTFCAAAIFSAATPPVFAIAATFRPTRIILPMRFTRFIVFNDERNVAFPLKNCRVLGGLNVEWRNRFNSRGLETIYPLLYPCILHKLFFGQGKQL
jgi:hypothetical protein